jgi:deoxyribose-phosphate aldolase
MRALSLLDLTSLNDDDDDAAVNRLCERAMTAYGPVAAVCVWPRFVRLCQRRLDTMGIRVASVANFPDGGTDIAAVIRETTGLVDFGVDEVDLVMPYRVWLEGERALSQDVIAACREICAAPVTLKVILETGCLGSAANIAGAAGDAIEAGADFVKSSTGKTRVSATPAAVETMLAVVRQAHREVGCKAAGGIRTVEQAGRYLDLADRIMGGEWATPKRFRFGASTLLDDILETLDEAGDTLGTSTIP